MTCSNIVRILGEVGDIERESEAILLENSIEFADFSEEIIGNLPQLPWMIPKVCARIILNMLSVIIPTDC